MRRFRIIITLLVLATAALALAPAALASTANGIGGGQGWYGETTDQVITNAMFIVIIFFPAVILVFSLILGRLEKRKHIKMDASKRRAVNADWRGGW